MTQRGVPALVVTELTSVPLFHGGHEWAVQDLTGPENVPETDPKQWVAPDRLVVGSLHLRGTTTAPGQHHRALVGIIGVSTQLQPGSAIVMRDEDRRWGVRLPSHTEVERLDRRGHG